MSKNRNRNPVSQSQAPQPDALLNSEQAKYESVWSQDSYRVRNQGLELWTTHREIFGNPQTAVDIGCGNGRLISQWLKEGINGWGIDFAHNAPDACIGNKVVVGCLWNEWPIVPSMIGDKFDLGSCTDVLEHIPPEKVDAVLGEITKRCHMVVFEIANYPSHYGDLHLSLHDAEWWLAKLNEYGTAQLLPIARSGVKEYVFRLTTSSND